MTGGGDRARVDGREHSTRRGHVLGWAAVALGLVTIVAMEANGAAWSPHRGTEMRPLPRPLIVGGAVTAAVVATTLFLLAIANVRAVETREHRRRRWMTALIFLVTLAAIAFARLVIHPGKPATDARRAPEGGGKAASGGTGSTTSAPETWWPLVIVVLGTAGAFSVAMARGSRTGATADLDDDAHAAAIAMLDASLEDLRREPDPRRAVVAAYARMERGLGGRGFARQPWETPTEYLARALTDDTFDHAAVVEPLAALTALAERARFSARPVDEHMRDEAVHALAMVRAALRHDPAIGVAFTSGGVG